MLSQGLPELGARIGEFELREALGTGGFGAVFVAHQERLNRDVALKVLYPEAARSVDGLASRFKREIDLARRLEHPNIVRLYDYGETDAGLLWMAMELVRGKELNRMVKTEGAFDPARAKKIMLQVLSALADAHSQNIVHRDLKPGNIMLTDKGADKDVVKLLDFGIGKAFGEQENSAVQDLTVEESAIFGTPRYMAPELLMKESEGPHSDVYAAGLIWYELLIGRAAVEGDSTFQILAKQIKERLALPSHLQNSALAPILLKACHKDWRKRYPTALEFHADMLALDLSAPVTGNVLEAIAALEADGDISARLEDVSLITGALNQLDDMMEISVVDDDSLEIDADGVILGEPEPSQSRTGMLFLMVGVVVVIVAIILATMTSSEPTEETDKSPRVASSGGTVTPPQPAPTEAEVSFASTPSASLTIDGDVRCTSTPCTLTLPIGELEATFEAMDHQPVVHTFTATDGSSVAVALIPKAKEPPPEDPALAAAAKAEEEAALAEAQAEAERIAEAERLAAAEAKAKRDAAKRKRDKKKKDDKKNGGGSSGGDDPFNMKSD